MCFVTIIMASFTTPCASCKRKFKTLYSLTKHAATRHGINDSDIVAVFQNSEGTVATPPEMKSVPDRDLVGYKMWLAGLVERINSLFHPRLPGEYNSIDLLIEMITEPCPRVNINDSQLVDVMRRFNRCISDKRARVIHPKSFYFKTQWRETFKEPILQPTIFQSFFFFRFRGTCDRCCYV